MSAMSDYLEQKLLDHSFNQVAFTSPSTYVALFTTPPSDSGGGIEVSVGAYARQLVNPNSGGVPKWNLASSPAGLIDNANDIAYPQATADWGVVKAAGLFDASASGNMLMHGLLGTNRKQFTGLATDDNIYSPAHGFANNDRVVFVNTGSGLPTGVSEATEYYVVNATTNNFQVSATQGGAAINLTADGDGEVLKSGFRDVKTNDTFKFLAGDLDLIFK